MKRKILWALAPVCAGVILLFACEKESQPLPGKSNSLMNSIMRDGDKCDEGVRTACGGDLLAFSDTGHFRRTYECLENAYEQWNDDIETNYYNPLLPDSIFDNLIDSLAIDDEQPLIDFETSLSFVSFRRVQRLAEDNWLDTAPLDTLNEPDEDNPFDDPVLEAMMSQYGEVKIGSSIFKYYADGTSLEITDGNCQTLDSIRRDSSYASKCANVITTPTPGKEETCRWYKKKSSSCTYGSSPSRRIKYKHTFYTYAWGAFDRAITKSYKKKSNGKWKRYTAYLEVKVQGEECNEGSLAYASTLKTGHRKRMVARYPKAGKIEFYRIRNNKSWSRHYVEDGDFPNVASETRFLYLWW